MMGCCSTALEVAVALTAAALLLAAAGAADNWQPAHATFYNANSLFSNGGACGYEDMTRQGYGPMTTALSTAFFNNGGTCGACYELQCSNDPQWCLRGTVTVTATDFCPPSNKPGTAGGWCNPPLRHFDLNMPAFLKIAKYKAGIVPVLYRRVPCLKSGGIRFEMKGNKDFISVLVYNVAGAGDVAGVAVKGARAGQWVPMKRNWGAVWSLQGQSALVGQALSFRVTAGDGKVVDSEGIAPASWQFGQTYEGRNF